MTARSARSRKWLGGALRTGRAAAFLVLATGINGTIAALEPRYEPIYVYLGSVVIVAWLGSFLLGVTTAVAAVILYDWMFSPVRMVPSLASVVPFTIAITAAIATRFARVPFTRRVEISPSPAPPLLPVAEGEIVRPVAVDRSEINDLQRRLNDSVAEARLRHASLQQELDAARTESAQQGKRADAARAQLENATRRGTDIEERIGALQQELDLAWRKADEEKSRADREASHFAGLKSQHDADLTDAQRRIAEIENSRRIVQQQLESAKKIAQEEHARAERESTLRGQLENAARTTLHRTADVSSSHQRAAEEAQQKVLIFEAELAAEKQASLDLKAQSAELEVQAAAVHEELDRVRAILEEETARADREAELREIQEITADRKHDIHLAEARARIVSIQEETVALQAALDEERAARVRVEEETSRNLERIVAGITTDHQSSLAQALTDKEAARAELRALTQRVEKERGHTDQQRITRERIESTERDEIGALTALAVGLRAELEREQKKSYDERTARTSAESEWNEKLTRIVAGITTDYENSIGDSLVERETARAELRTLTSKVAEMRTALDMEKAAKNALESEWNAKLTSIVAGITTDYENSIGDSLVEKEAARAEIRTLTSKVVEIRKALEIERTAKQSLELDWNEKLTRIVAGITTDYENTIGETLIEKEAARAELRSLTSKVAELRKALDAEKAANQTLETEWSEKLQKIVGHLASDHDADVGEAMMEKEAAKAEVRTLTARLGALQQQLRELTPLSDHSPVVLVVHSDAQIREMSKHALEQSGYSVLTAGDGLEGLRYASANHPDVVLAEAIMPKMNGRELVQLLKSRPETASVKIVLMSGNVPAEGGTDFRADGFIADPHDFQAMRETLAKVLGGI
ncbi:MAG: response regulator [Thermoanaerobaculia bacterium]|nr:response regulator [Thermoanaerobaculia bacterium]